MKKIIVIGGGPAGMMAAIEAAESGAQVTLLEKNADLGKKLMLTGKGRCNVTNACALEDFLNRFRRNGDFLRDALKAFSNRDLMDFFRRQGVPLKVERQQRVFPESDRAGSIVKALTAVLKKKHVDIQFGAVVSGLEIHQGKIAGVKVKGKGVQGADAVILATGGLSYRGTGSTGEGLDFARDAGHRIEEVRPALIGLQTKQSFPKQLQGLTLKNIVLTFYHGRKKIKTDVGDLLFTHLGISGPLVISMSGMVVDWLRNQEEVFAEIDLKPAVSQQDLDRRLMNDFKAEPKKIIKNLLKGFLPQRMVETFLNLAEVDPEKQVNKISHEERHRLLELFKRMRMDIGSADPFGTAMVTQGGVSVREIDPKTMSSRIVKGLYFAGEMVDIDGDTGGFNLQAAFSTGYLAGKSSAKG
jgi:predicted Rossmann fold flavoprotein